LEETRCTAGLFACPDLVPTTGGPLCQHDRCEPIPRPRRLPGLGARPRVLGCATRALGQHSDESAGRGPSVHTTAGAAPGSPRTTAHAAGSAHRAGPADLHAPATTERPAGFEAAGACARCCRRHARAHFLHCPDHGDVGTRLLALHVGGLRRTDGTAGAARVGPPRAIGPTARVGCPDVGACA
jgi:hypothetical protein